MAARTAPIIPPMVPTTMGAPPVKGVMLLVGRVPVDPAKPELGADVVPTDEAEPAEDATLADETAEVAGEPLAALDAGDAPEVALALVAGADVGEAEVAGAELEAGPAEETQAQMDEASAWTARPVTSPQPLRTQLKAAAWIALDEAGVHWQARSV
ncbi:hypothetical protein MMC20_005000 [Loxospora ochrophaea]|nr:hypothetical protein [Loxospora ochrophaea]